MEPFIYLIKYLISIKFKFHLIAICNNEALSSANQIGLDLSDTLLERSLMYIRNNKGPRIELCWTPCRTSSHLEKFLFQ